MSRQPGDDDNGIDDVDAEDEGEEEGPLVPLGDVLVALDKERAAAAHETATDLLLREQTPPHALDAERAVLGAMMMQGSCIDVAIEEGLAPEHFYRPHHGTIFEVILALKAKGEPVDTLTVVDELLARGQLDTVGGAAAISQLEALLPTVAHVGAYSKLVKDKANLREIITMSVAAAGAAFAQDRPADILDDIRKATTRIEQAGTTGVRSLHQMVRAARARMPALGGVRITVPFGYVDVDKFFHGGVQPGELIVIAARPSMGKTQFILGVADHLAIKRRKRGMFFSLEMDGEALVNRLAGLRTGIDTRRPEASLSPTEKGLLELAMGQIFEAPLVIDDRAAPSAEQIFARAKMEHDKEPLDFVMVDHLGYVGSGNHPKNATRDEIVGAMTKRFKALARALKIPVYILCQLNRGVESRADKRPMMMDLRESGNIEADADVIAFLYREEYYEKARTPEDKKGIAEFIVSKNRDGNAGASLRLRFAGDHPRFQNLAHEGDVPFGEATPNGQKAEPAKFKKPTGMARASRFTPDEDER